MEYVLIVAGCLIGGLCASPSSFVYSYPNAAECTFAASMVAGASRPVCVEGVKKFENYTQTSCAVAIDDTATRFGSAKTIPVPCNVRTGQ